MKKYLVFGGIIVFLLVLFIARKQITHSYFILHLLYGKNVMDEKCSLVVHSSFPTFAYATHEYIKIHPIDVEYNFGDVVTLSWKNCYSKSRKMIVAVYKDRSTFHPVDMSGYADTSAYRQIINSELPITQESYTFTIRDTPDTFWKEGGQYFFTVGDNDNAYFPKIGGVPEIYKTNTFSLIK